MVVVVVEEGVPVIAAAVEDVTVDNAGIAWTGIGSSHRLRRDDEDARVGTVKDAGVLLIISLVFPSKPYVEEGTV